MRHLQKRLLCTTVAVVAAVGWVALPTGANASLIGTDITITSTANIPVDTWSDTVTVGAGIELAGGDASNHANTNQGQMFKALFTGDFIDVGESSITINYAALGVSGFSYAFITDYTGLDWGVIPGTLTNVTIAAGDTGLLAHNISNITATSFTFQGTVDLVNGALFTLDLTVVHDVPAIPLPAAFPLFGTGLGILGLIGWRRRRKAV